MLGKQCIHTLKSVFNLYDNPENTFPLDLMGMGPKFQREDTT